jgi:hypothetical protein
MYTSIKSGKCYLFTSGTTGYLITYGCPLSGREKNPLSAGAMSGGSKTLEDMNELRRKQ